MRQARNTLQSQGLRAFFVDLFPKTRWGSAQAARLDKKDIQRAKTVENTTKKHLCNILRKMLHR
jgi:hypothetical protein